MTGLDPYKALRTLQSYVPALKPVKERVQIALRRLRRRPHEDDFLLLPRLGLGAAPACLDIGTNYGQSIDSIGLMLPGAAIVAFEPNPGLAARVRRRFAGQGGLTLHQVALGEAEGELTLYVPVYRGYEYDGLASLDREAAANWISADTVYRFDRRRLEIREIAVPIRRLDSYDLRPRFVKIDVQGAELQVLRGGRETLAAARPIVLAEAVDEDSPVMRFMAELGYRRFVRSGDRLVHRGPYADNVFLIPSEARLEAGVAEA
ncbi:MAG: FkbM family methyltransferase [Alphaproteobacteria bacterium]